MTLGHRLTRRRASAGVSQRALARRARMSQGYVAQLERGLRTNPSMATVERLAKALGVPLTKLLD